MTSIPIGLSGINTIPASRLESTTLLLLHLAPPTVFGIHSFFTAIILASTKI